MIKPIKTPKGFENYIPWGSYGTLEALKEKYPNDKLFFSATRKGIKFKAGQWVRLNNGEKVKIIAFDHYNYPLPVEMLGKPKAKFTHNGYYYEVWDSKHRKITRAIYADVHGFYFHDLEEWKWLKK